MQFVDEDLYEFLDEVMDEVMDEDMVEWLEMESRASRRRRRRRRDQEVSTSNELTEHGMDEVLDAISMLLRDGNISSSSMADQMTSEDEKDPDQELQEQPASHEHLTLETIPNEIISSIAGMMAVSIDLPYEVSRPDLATSEDRMDKDADARRDLTNLCMVSKRMASNAQRVLYRNILITNANTLILLYRAFLENPKLGVHVKRMSLNIDHGREPKSIMSQPLGEFPRVFDGSPIDLSLLLPCVQHGLGEQFRQAAQDSRHAPGKIPVDILFALQFRVLSHTSNLESLDINVHPFLPLIRTYTRQKMKKRHWEEFGAVLCSLWEDVLPRLSKVKKLQMIGNHEPLDRLDVMPTARKLFSAQICRCLLKLPSLEQIVWVNYSKHWFTTLPFLVVSGIGTDSRFELVKILELQESPCLPQGLDTICCAFPNLELLSVDNGCRHEYFEPYMPYFLSANGDSIANDAGGTSLTDSLTSLKDLKTLSLDLHYYHEIRGTFGPLGILSLAGLRNLETLEVPFHFFARSVLPDGYHQSVSPHTILPRGLKALRIMACYECDTFEDGNPATLGFDPGDAVFRYWPPPGDHGDALLKFLEDLASLHDEYSPSLKDVCYEEARLDDDFGTCRQCGRDSHHKSGLGDWVYLSAVEQLLRQKGVVFDNRSELFHCLA